MTETFYDHLGVEPDATTEEIEDAYREAIKQVHPDVSDDVDAGERTKRLNKAKRVLTDDEERAKYDSLGHAAYTGEGAKAGDGGTGPSSRPESDSDAASAGATSQSDASDRTTATGTGRGRERASGSGASDAATGGSTWRDSRRRGRRSEAGRSANGTEGRRKERARGRKRTDGYGETGVGDGTTRSTGGSTGPTWQSNGTVAGGGVGEGGEASGGSASAQRQAAAGATDGPNVDWSWNAWDATGAWAVRNGSEGTRRLRLSRLFPIDQSVVLLVSTFICYPFFIAATLYPAFPLAARVVVGVCTLLTFAYLLSIPEAAILVFGLWSVVVPIFLLAVPGLGIFTLAGVVGLTATWVPLGMSVLTFTLVRS